VVWDAIQFGTLGPDELVALAALPVIIAILLRALLGRTQLTRWATTLGTMWFAINVLLAPYSDGIRQDLLELGNTFR
jgi:hypothetical protein